MVHAVALLLLSASAHATPLLPQIVIKPLDLIRGGIIFGAGDVVAQSFEHHVEGRSPASELRKGTLVDATRFVHAALIGTFHGGLILPFVYQLAEGLFPGRTARNVMCKTAVSCGLLSTGGNYYGLLTRRLLHPARIGESFKERVQRCVDSVHDLFADVILDDLKVWPLYDVLCFAVVPPALRPIATAVVSTCWHTYISFVASRAATAGAATH